MRFDWLVLLANIFVRVSLTICIAQSPSTPKPEARQAGVDTDQLVQYMYFNIGENGWSVPPLISSKERRIVL